jgi:hypothetical protein
MDPPFGKKSWLRNSRQQRNVPVRLTSKTDCHCETRSIFLPIQPSRVIPAQLIRIDDSSNACCSWDMDWNSCRTWSSLEMSHFMLWAFGPHSCWTDCKLVLSCLSVISLVWAVCSCFFENKSADLPSPRPSTMHSTTTRSRVLSADQC